MKRIYPKDCCRCGFCCLAETCPIGQLHFRIDKYTPCPALKFNGNKAKCQLVKKNLIPVKDGCCIKARAFKDGVQYDFASLPDHLKKQASLDRRRRGLL